jgi:hypothetical protein
MRRLYSILGLLLLGTFVTAAATTAPARHVAKAPARAHRAASAPRAEASDFETGADSNAVWPDGWRRGGNQPAGRIERLAPGHASGHALRLTASGTNGYLAIVRKLPDTLRAGCVAVRLSGWLRTEGAGRAALWIHLLNTGNTLASDESPSRWPHGDSAWTRYEVVMPVLPEMEHVTYGLSLSGGGVVWADDIRLEALTPEQLPPSTPVARNYLAAALDTLCRRFSQTAVLNWGVLKRAATTQMIGGQVPADAYPALRYAVTRLDPEGELIPPGRMRSGELSVPWFVEEEGPIGTMRLPACTSDSRAERATYADSTRRRIEGLAAKGARGWVVDLRVVSGGEVEPALAGLGPLVGEGRLLSWIRPDGRRGEWTQRHGMVEVTPGMEPDRRLVSVTAPELELPGVPVAVLIGPRTAAAGEALALAFRGRPNTRFFGEPTAGRSQARERVRLSDGAVVRYATGRMYDRNGKPLDGAFMPDDSLNAALLTGGRDSLTTLALEWVRGAIAKPR